MNDIEKIFKSRIILKELLFNEWKTENMPNLSKEEIKQLYNSSEDKNSIYSNFGKGSICNFILDHKILDIPKLHIIYYNFPDFGKKKIKITKSIENKIELLYKNDSIGQFDSLFIIINENITDSIISIKNNINSKLKESNIDITSIKNDIEKLNLTKSHFRNVNIYSLNSLQINISKHKLVPKHTIIRDINEIKKILEKCNCKINQLPSISKEDPMAKIFRMIPGDLFKIERINKKGNSIYYRICK